MHSVLVDRDSQSVITVDDTNLDIQYTGSWDLGGMASEWDQ